MDQTTGRTKPDWLNNRAKAAGETIQDAGGDYDGEDNGEECDSEAWNTLSRSFRQAQTVLDENRALIQEVNSNHESRIHDKMVKNVGLIHQINGNISKVLSIYSDLSVDFLSVVRQRRVSVTTNRDGDKEENSVEDSSKHVPEKSKWLN